MQLLLSLSTLLKPFPLHLSLHSFPQPRSLFTRIRGREKNHSDERSRLSPVPFGGLSTARDRVSSRGPLPVLWVLGLRGPGSPSARAGRPGGGRSAGAAGRGRRGDASGAERPAEDAGSERGAEVAPGSRARGPSPRGQLGGGGGGGSARRLFLPNAQNSPLRTSPRPRLAPTATPGSRTLSPARLRPASSRAAPTAGCAALGYKGGKMSRAAAVRRGARRAAAIAAAPGTT